MTCNLITCDQEAYWSLQHDRWYTKGMKMELTSWLHMIKKLEDLNMVDETWKMWKVGHSSWSWNALITPQYSWGDTEDGKGKTYSSIT